MPPFTKFQNTVLAFGEANFDFSTDVIKIALSNTAPNAASNVHFSDITEIAAGNGYVAGGATVGSVDWTQAAGVASLIGNAVSWTASGGTIGPFRYAVVYDESTGFLLGFWDYGTATTLPSGGTFSVLPDDEETGGTILTLT